MKNRTFFLLLVFYVPTILWGIIGISWYLSLVAEKNSLTLFEMINNVFSVSELFGALVLFVSYLVIVLVGLIFYAEKDFWKDT